MYHQHVSLPSNCTAVQQRRTINRSNNNLNITNHSETISITTNHSETTTAQWVTEINKELEVNTDTDRRTLLRSRLSVLLKEDNTHMLEQHKYIEPSRHLDIRNEFVRLRNNFKARVKYIDILKESENKVKFYTGDQYKHYSEDYPEVQLLLQQTEIQKQKKGNKQGAYKRFERKLGDFEPLTRIEDQDFDPFGGKVGDNNEPKVQ